IVGHYMRNVGHILILLIIFALNTPSIAQTKQARQRVDLLITGGTVVTMDGERRVIENGAVAINGNTIVGVGTAPEMAKRFRVRSTMNAAGKAVIPGLINAHTH